MASLAGPASVSAPHLEWSEEPGRVESFPLTGAEVLIGRRSGAHIMLSHRLVSRQHARIVPEADGFVIIDLQSSHGTFVNGQRVERHRLRPNDRIRLGDQGVEILFLTPRTRDSNTSQTLWEGAGLERSVRRLASVLPDETSGHTELEKISCLLDFHYHFGKAFSADRTFNHILKSALRISGAERGYILKKQGAEFEYAVGMDRGGNTLGHADFRTSGSVVERVARDGLPVFMTQGIHGDLAASESIVAMHLRALACLPLEALSPETDSAEIRGILYLDSRRHMHALSGVDEKLLTRLADEAGHVLEKLEMVVALDERKRIDQELAIAQETQRTLLPHALPRYDPFEIRAFCRPTRQLGGDFYDFISLGSGPLTGVLADVSGKGIPAALLSSLTLGALNMEFRSSPRPDRVLNGVNKLLCEKTPINRFVTLFLFQLDAAGKGQYIGAGHNPAYLFRAATGELEELSSGGIPLGMFPAASYEPVPLELGAGDLLTIYSDGLTDAENGAGDDFGEDRLKRLIALSAGQGAAALEASLLQELDQFTRGASQTDDITFLLIENRP